MTQRETGLKEHRTETQAIRGKEKKREKKKIESEECNPATPQRLIHINITSINLYVNQFIYYCQCSGRHLWNVQRVGHRTQFRQQEFVWMGRRAQPHRNRGGGETGGCHVLQTWSWAGTWEGHAPEKLVLHRQRLKKGEREKKKKGDWMDKG